MIGFLVFALPAIAVLALLAGQALFGLTLLGAAAVCFLLVARVGATRR